MKAGKTLAFQKIWSIMTFSSKVDDLKWAFQSPGYPFTFPPRKIRSNKKLCGHRTWPMVFECHLMTTDMSGEELLETLERESTDASLGLYYERHKTHKVGLFWESWKDIDERYKSLRHGGLGRSIGFAWDIAADGIFVGLFFPPQVFPSQCRVVCRECRCLFGMEGTKKKLIKKRQRMAEKSIFPSSYRKFNWFLGWYPKWPCNL